jgi:hypothetical protein
MPRPTTSTPAHSRSIDFDASDPAGDARAWLDRRLRWEHRLTELRALPGPGDLSGRRGAGQRTVAARSGVLERPGRSSGVRA